MVSSQGAARFRNRECSKPFTAIRRPSSSVASVASYLASVNLDAKDELEEVNIDFYPPDPDYDIAEKPWLPGPQTPYVLIGANLVDPREKKVHKNMTLHLAEGKVYSVEPTTPSDSHTDFYHGTAKAQKIDASKYFICPGLIDCKFPMAIAKAKSQSSNFRN
jgi:hypothetical protein